MKVENVRHLVDNVQTGTLAVLLPRLSVWIDDLINEKTHYLLELAVALSYTLCKPGLIPG